MNKLILIAFASFLVMGACKQNKNVPQTMSITPPKADKKPKNLEVHGDVRVDDYYWLNDRENEEVIDYLERENDYYQKMTAHTTELQKQLFEEMKSRIKEDDSSVPYFYNGYYYITRYETGKDYPIHTRKKENLDAEEEILFDVNEMAKEYSYYNLNGINISPDNTKVAFGVDTLSRRKYTIHIKNLETGDLYPESIDNTTGGSTWANDNSSLFYTRKDEQTLRSNKIYKHQLGDDVGSDQEVYSEDDDTFSTYVYKTKSEAYIVIGSYSTLSSEVRILDANTPDGEFTVFNLRENDLEYGIEHFNGNFYVLTNADGAKNFKLMKTPVSATSKDNWEELIAHRADVLLEDIDIFQEYLVVSERFNGLNEIRIIPWDKNTPEHYLPFDNETYTANPTQNIDFNTQLLRYNYNSLNTPASVIDYNMGTKEKTVLKETEVLGGAFNKDNYVSERVWATAEDGTKIPMSLVYKKGLKKDAANPVFQYAYGSYGYTSDPRFSSVRLSLLDRGFVYAISHVRGGDYMGRAWYDDGKLFKKKNTFTDFIDCSKYLIEEGYTSSDHLYAYGGSAGGLLMGAIVNMSPELYNGVIAAVPFVDVITTMLDDSIPLTTSEYDEWGNPNDLDAYNYIKSYSPYDQVAAKEYPNLYVTTGLHDSQVQYWEPAKWVAKLREVKTDNNLLYLDTNMDAGHGGASGRFEALKEIAKDYAFIFDLEGIKE